MSDRYAQLRAVLASLPEVAEIDPVALGRAALAKRCERSLAFFIKTMWPVLEQGRPLAWGWAFDAVCLHLEAVTRGEIRRLLINCPPGFSKSLITNVFWPAWEWARGMPTSYMTGSHREDLAERDSYKLRALIMSEEYQALFGDRVQVATDQGGKTRFSLTNTGFNLAVPSRSMIGERASRVKLDDPHSVEGAESDAERNTMLRVFAETVPSRLKDPERDAIIVIMQRLAEEDCSALAIRLGYTHLCLPMEYEADHPYRWVGAAANQNQYGPGDPRKADGELLCPERMSRHAVEELKAQLRVLGGDYAVAAQLQQRPAPRGGGMFKREWLPIISAAEVPKGGEVCRGWDLAGTDGAGAFTRGVRLRLVNDVVYIEDAVGGQLAPGGVEDLIVATTKLDADDGCEQDLPRDPGQAGVAQMNYIAKRLHGYKFHFSPETGRKDVRAQPLAAQASSGNVKLVRGDWNRDFIAEAVVFPNGRYKDQVDAASRAYANLVQRRRGPRVAVGASLSVLVKPLVPVDPADRKPGT